MGNVEHRCFCGCVTYLTPADEGPWGVVLVTACDRHTAGVEAEAEACAVGAAGTRLAALGYDCTHEWAGDHWVFRIDATDDEIDALRATLNATEPDQDWRVGWVAPEHRDAFHALVVGHLLASVLASR